MGTDETIVELHGREWLSRAEMADRLDVSERTVTRMAGRGELLRRENPDGRGNVYRRADDQAGDARHETGHETRQDTDVDPSDDPPEDDGTRDTRQGRQDTRRDRTRDTRHPMRDTADGLVDLVREQGERIGDLERKVGELEERNEWLRAELEAVRDTDAPDEDRDGDQAEDRDDERPRATDGLHPLVAELKRTAED